MQTKEGSKKAMETIYKRYGKDHFREIGRRGGKKSIGGGFADGEIGRAIAKTAGSIGGKKSKHGYKLLEDLGDKGRYLNKKTNEEVVLYYETKQTIES